MIASRKTGFVIAALAALGLCFGPKAHAANALANPSFDFVGMNGPFTSHSGGPGALGESAAQSWRVYHSNPGTTRTALLPSSAVPGSRMIYVATTEKGNGLLQAFASWNKGPKQVKSVISVFVVKGQVGIGIGNGALFQIDAVSTMNGVWEVVSAPNSVSPASTFVILATTPGAEFYVDEAIVDF